MPENLVFRQSIFPILKEQSILYHARIYRPFPNILMLRSHLPHYVQQPLITSDSHATFSSEASPIERRRPVHRLYRSRRPHPQEWSCRRPPICPAEYDRHCLFFVHMLDLRRECRLLSSVRTKATHEIYI